MNPGRIPRTLPTAIGVAVAVALAVSAQTYLSMRGHGHAFVRILGWQLSCWVFWALLTPLVLRSATRVPVAAHTGRDVMKVIVVGVLLILSHVGIASQLTVAFQPYVPAVTHSFTTAFRDQLILVPIDVFVYGTLVVTGYALGVSGRARELRIRESKLEAELARANLEALRLEIRPHFLFNTLNSIAALIRSKDGGRALEMLLGLSELLRATVERPARQFISLDEELSLAKRYIDLQQTRFSDRVNVRYDVAAGCLPVGVPTFFLQPLLENAFRHGVAQSAMPCTIEIAARLEGPVLHVSVADSAATLPPTFNLDDGAGTGLRNVASRLEQLFGSAASLELRAVVDGKTVVDVRFPASSAYEAETVAASA